jgi:hypothetical protein
MSAQTAGEELFPALESLSRVIAPHFKTIIFIALVFNQTPIFPDVQSLIISQLSNPLVLIVALYFGAIWSLPNGQENNDSTWSSLLGPFYALKTVSTSVGTYLKGGIDSYPKVLVTDLQLSSWLVTCPGLSSVRILQRLPSSRTMGTISVHRHLYCHIHLCVPLCPHQ